MMAYLPETKTVPMGFRIDPSDAAKLHAAAQRENMSFSEWARSVLLAEAAAGRYPARIRRAFADIVTEIEKEAHER